MDELTLHYGEIKIPYKLIFTPKPLKKVLIHVHPDGSVQVDAPANSSLQSVKKAVYKKARWICNKYLQQKDYHKYALPREYVSGESCYYLGRQYVLKVIKVSRQTESVKLIRGQLQVRTKRINKNHVKKLVAKWYRDHAHAYLEKRLGEIAQKINWIKKQPSWKLVSMKKQWGSCSPKGMLSLNPELIKAPKDCIDYVIIHEICHLRVHNHSKQFYKLLESTFPGWESIKTRLDAKSESILSC